ncbi:MAG: hypothetical protein AB1762_04140 [Gemmatimonadota bacterium]
MLALPQFTPGWKRAHEAAQFLGLALTAVLLFGLVAQPRTTLHILWDMVIPLLPAVFLVNPMLWRNVCPLATLNVFTGARRSPGALSSAHLKAGWTIGLALLAVMVPARRFVFNSDGPMLALTIVVVACVALLAGVLAPRRAGFCNSLCPVLPVEKLYGQSPLVKIGVARCNDCSVCTPLGCIDLAREKAARQTLGPGAQTSGWIATPFGLFAAAFPGFIIGYFTLSDGSLATASVVYQHVIVWVLASVAMTAAIVLAFDVSARLGTAALGALAVGLYYWYASPTLSEAYGGGATAANALRAAALALIGWWFARTKSWTRSAWSSD